jgi:transposase
MTLHAQNEFSIPEETARVARAAYPKGNLYMKMRDALGTIYQDESFAQLFPQNGRPVEAPWRLAFITVVQFIEELADRQAAEAVRGRIDLKYALGLELTDPGFDFTLLTDFRARLIQGGGEQVLLDAMLTLFKERGWRKRATKATHRFHPHPGQDSCHQSTAVCRGSDAFRASTVSRSLPATGSWSTVMKHGCVGMGIAWKRGVFPKARQVAWRWQKPLDKMAGDCSPTCLMKPRLRFCGKFLQSTSCVKSGCRTIATMTGNCIGASPPTFLRQPASSIRLTIRKPATAKNTVRAGLDTKCI